MCLFSSQWNTILIRPSFCLTKFYLLLFCPVRVVHYWGFLCFFFSPGKSKEEILHRYKIKVVEQFDFNRWRLFCPNALHWNNLFIYLHTQLWYDTKTYTHPPFKFNQYILSLLMASWCITQSCYLPRKEIAYKRFIENKLIVIQNTVCLETSSTVNDSEKKQVFEIIIIFWLQILKRGLFI